MNRTRITRTRGWLQNWIGRPKPKIIGNLMNICSKHDNTMSLNTDFTLNKENRTKHAQTSTSAAKAIWTFQTEKTSIFNNFWFQKSHTMLRNMNHVLDKIDLSKSAQTRCLAARIGWQTQTRNHYNFDWNRYQTWLHDIVKHDYHVRLNKSNQVCSDFDLGGKTVARRWKPKDIYFQQFLISAESHCLIKHASDIRLNKS